MKGFYRNHSGQSIDEYQQWSAKNSSGCLFWILGLVNWFSILYPCCHSSSLNNVPDRSFLGSKTYNVVWYGFFRQNREKKLTSVYLSTLTHRHQADTILSPHQYLVVGSKSKCSCNILWCAWRIFWGLKLTPNFVLKTIVQDFQPYENESTS